MSNDINDAAIATPPIEFDNSIFEIPVPEEVACAGAPSPECISPKEQLHYPNVQLFFSFDIVNSTMYKAMTENWPLIIRSLLEDIRVLVHRKDILSTCYLWRVIGDEMVFVLPIHSENTLPEVIDAVFEVTQRISISLKSGKFFDTLEDQSLHPHEISMLKSQNTLSVKSAAWIAVVNTKNDSPFDNITFEYAASTHNQVINEFLGKDIDTGFRLKEHTQDRRLCISVELAYFLTLAGKQENLHILDYVRLKGVWNEALYPVIWYYNSEIVGNCHLEMTGHKEATPFANSFRYDETDNNPIVKQYFLRGQKKKHNIATDSNGLQLAASMYVAKSALPKIVVDKLLLPKIEYFQKHFRNEQFIRQVAPYVPPLGLHCAVVCCDTSNRKVLIAHRGTKHGTNPGKWEFGCAKANSRESLMSSIKEYYQKAFGAEIELVIDSTREDQQPVPLAIYELHKPEGDMPKGIILVAKVTNVVTPDLFRAEGSHDEIRWISEEDASTYSPNEVIQDFHNTLHTVFSNFDNYFKGNGNLNA